MRRLVFSVPPEYVGTSLKGFLSSFCRLSVRQTAKLKRVPGGICRNGFPASTPEILKTGDRIALTFPDDRKIPEPAFLPLPVAYEDRDLLVVKKPAFMPMVPSPGHDRDTLANAVAWLEKERGESFAFRPVFRLDRDTTGLVVLAKNAYAASRLSGKVSKLYLAVCDGRLEGEGKIQLPVGRKPGHTIQRAVIPGGKPAVTLWRSLRAGNSHSLLALKLRTGRTHQIRVHLSALGHPLSGDTMYGGEVSGIGRQALHCCRILLRHPVTGRRLCLKSGLPEDMRSLIGSDFF